MFTLDKVILAYFIVAAALLVPIVLWCFRDGRRRGRSGLLVALLVLWTFPLGVLLWLYFRPAIPPEEIDIPEDPDHDLKQRANAGML